MTDMDALNSVLDDLRGLINDPGFQLEAIDEMSSLLLRKGEDYSGQNHTWMSFVVTANVGQLTVDQVFFALIGTKISRLVSLLSSDTPPNFEGVDDTWLDLANYIVLLIGYKRYLAGKDLE